MSAEPSSAPASAPDDSPFADSLFLRACRRQPVERTPVWIMRQAGRYLPQYRAVRKELSFLELCKTPEKAAEVTIQPLDELDVDAAILFCDILIPLEPLGMGIAFGDGGPKIETPDLSVERLRGLPVPDPCDTLPFVMDTIRVLRRELAARERPVPLIGFAGAPFTLASYVVEGGTSRDFRKLKRLLFESPEAAHALLGKLADGMAAYLSAQIEAGAQAVQLFDTWAGVLGAEDYATFAAPYARRVIEQLPTAPGGGHAVPVVYYVNGVAAILERMVEVGSDVISVDWRTPLDEVRRRVGDGVAIQGNLDPACLYLPPDELAARARAVLAAAEGAAGHVFNLGHGIFLDVDPARARHLVETVQRESVRPGAGG